MIKTFSAIFENGVFRPVEPVDFPEHCQVQVEVRSVEPSANDATLDEVYDVLSKRFNSEKPVGDQSPSESPMPQRVRLVGRLSAIRADANAFDLVLDDGGQVAVQWIGGDLAGVTGLGDERVLVLGTAIFGPPGNLLRIDANDVTLSSDGGSFFSAIPRPVSPGFDLDDVLREQRHKRGLSAIIGQWPGDESDEEVAAALKELS